MNIKLGLKLRLPILAILITLLLFILVVTDCKDKRITELFANKQSLASTPESSSKEKAYTHLNGVMDKLNNTFNIYTDADAGGNHYIPSGWMGDWGDIIYNGNNTENPNSGPSSVRIDYLAQGSQGNNWAGIYWQHPENNWGNLNGGYSLQGASKLTFWARGKEGGEWVDFKIGGINRIPIKDPDKPYQDTFGPIGTGFTQLSKDWKQYTISLDKDYFDIYRDQHVAYVPSGWMGDIGDITFDDKYAVDTYTGRTSIRINYSAQGSQGNNWAGVYWQNPEDNWGDKDGGYDLGRFERLTFWAKGENGGEKTKFIVGGITGAKGDSDKKEIVVTLSNSWKEYTIDLSGADLSHIVGGFGWSANKYNNPNGATFYLDDIRYERLLSTTDLSKVIGGFAWVASKDSNPNGAIFYIDDIKYDKAHPDALRLLNSYEIIDPATEKPIANAAFTYDNALAILVYMARGTEDDLRRAKIIADTFVYAQNHDRDYPPDDGRLRNAYRSGNITDAYDGDALLPGWWDEEKKEWLEDKEFISSSTGNIAWAMIALLTYYEEKGGQKYLNASVKMGNWVESNTRDSLGAGGYNGGYQGWANNEEKLTWKSTEHNIDLYVAFTRLYKITGDSEWQDRANHAKKFIEAMRNPDPGYFWTGTLTDGITKNTSTIPLDPQTWAILAFPENKEYKKTLTWVEQNILTNCQEHSCPNYPSECPGFVGFDFNNDKDGIWFEGTAQMVTAYQAAGQYSKADTYLTELRKAQVSAKNNNGKGIVAACQDDVSTGFDWSYNNRLHIGATAWFIFAEGNYNPYWPDRVRPIATLTTPYYSTNQSISSVFKVAWSAIDPSPSSGIASYDVQYKVGLGGSWTNWKTNITTANARFTGTPGKTYYFRARARDRTGNLGNWSSAKYTIIPFDQTVASYSGTWSKALSSQLYKASSKYSSKKNAKAVYSFSNAREVSLIITKKPSGGYADIYIGTNKIKTVNFYSSTTQYRVPVKMISYSSPTSGIVKLLLGRRKSSLSSGYRVEIDGIAIKQ